MRTALKYEPLPLDDDGDLMREMKFTYKVADLIGRLQENRDKHKAAHAEAVAGWFIEVREEAERGAGQLAELIERALHSDTTLATDVRKFGFSVHSPFPEDHTEDYERVLDMLGLTTMEEIELDEDQFRQYVRDEWDWSSHFNTLSANYSAKARMSR